MYLLLSLERVGDEMHQAKLVFFISKGCLHVQPVVDQICREYPHIVCTQTQADWTAKVERSKYDVLICDDVKAAGRWERDGGRAILLGKGPVYICQELWDGCCIDPQASEQALYTEIKKGVHLPKEAHKEGGKPAKAGATF